MTEQDLIQVFRERDCLPHQAEFAAKFFAPDSPRKQALISPPGLGKSRVAVNLVSFAQSQGLTRRILILAPRALVSQIQYRLEQLAEANGLVVFDRRLFRELEAAVAVGQSPWSAARTVVVSIDLAKQEDIAASLASVSWDIVIFEEAHRLSGPQSRALLESFLNADAVPRFLFLSAVNLPPALTERVPDLTTTSWKPQDVRAWDGQQLLPALQVQTISYRRAPDEVGFLDELNNARDELSRAYGSNYLMTTLERCARSSTFAIEQAMQRLEGNVRSSRFGAFSMAPPGKEAESEQGEDQDVDIGLGGTGPRYSDPAALLGVLRRLIAAIEHVVSDEKLRTLTRALGSPDERRWACITCGFRDTLTYLAACLRDSGFRVYSLSGDWTFEERSRTVNEFGETGGVLVSTFSAAQGFEIPRLDLLVHYDIPKSPELVMRWQSRVEQAGRLKPCTVVLLRDESAVLKSENDALTAFRHLAEARAV